MKKGKGIIIIGVLFFISLCAFAFYDTLFPKEKEITVEVKEEEENLEEVGNILLSKIDKYNLYTYAENTESAIQSFNDDISSSETKAMYYYFLNNKIAINRQNVDNYLKELYNTSVLEYPNIIFDDLPTEIASYNGKTEEYEMNDVDYHLSLNRPLIIKKNNIERIGDNYILTVSYVYVPTIEKQVEIAYYADPLYKNKIETLNEFIETDENGNILDTEKAKTSYEQNYKNTRRPLYKYTFEKKDDYYLKIFEIDE